MTAYSERMKAHLAWYKGAKLNTQRNGSWGRAGALREYPHILATEDLQLNIIESARTAFWENWSEKAQSQKPPKLHRDFAHLNSSQAFAFNLFFPFLNGGDTGRSQLLRALGITPEPIREWEFEKVLDDKEATNFDVWIRLASGIEVSVEVKLTESDFGACASNPRRLEKLDTIYRPRLLARIPTSELEPAAFFRRYQILRNIMYAEPGRRIVLFLFPRQNHALRDGQRYIEGIAQGSQSIRSVNTESVIESLRSDVDDPSLRRHVALLSEKYLIPEPEGHPLPLSHPYSVADYRDQVTEVLRPVRASTWVSIVDLLPEPPGGGFAGIGARLIATGSPPRLLTYMFWDLIGRRTDQIRDANVRVTLDGFLGSAGFAQSPWLLLPVIGAWLKSPAAVRGALAALQDAFTEWAELGLVLPDAVPQDLKTRSLAPFLPQGRIRNDAFAQAFVDGALAFVLAETHRRTKPT